MEGTGWKFLNWRRCLSNTATEADTSFWLVRIVKAAASQIPGLQEQSEKDPSLVFSPECWVCLSVLQVFARNIILFLPHLPFHHFLNTLFTIPPLLLCFSFCDTVPSSPFLDFLNSLQFKCSKWFKIFQHGSARSQVEVLQIIQKIELNLHSLLTVIKRAFWHTKIFPSLGCFRSRERLLHFCNFVSDSTWNDLSSTAPILSFQKVSQSYWCRNYWYSTISTKHIPSASCLQT